MSDAGARNSPKRVSSNSSATCCGLAWCCRPPSFCSAEIVYLLRHGEEKLELKNFHGEPADLCSPGGSSKTRCIWAAGASFSSACCC